MNPIATKTITQKTVTYFLLNLLFLFHCSATNLYSPSNATDYVKNSPYMGYSTISPSSDYAMSRTDNSNDFFEPQNENNAQALRQSILKEARKHIGTPYQYGGNTPDGFDCSGFTSYVMGKHAIQLPRTASAQYAQLKAVKKPLPGDLVFFRTESQRVSHVGIYSGNLKMIHAPSSGKTVEEISLNNVYWKPRYVGARMIQNH